MIDMTVGVVMYFLVCEHWLFELCDSLTEVIKSSQSYMPHPHIIEWVWHVLGMKV